MFALATVQGPPMVVGHVLGAVPSIQVVIHKLVPKFGPSGLGPMAGILWVGLKKPPTIAAMVTETVTALATPI